MKLIDELYEIYRGRLQGSDEDLDMITLAVVEQLSNKEIFSIIKEMNEEELQYFFRLYLFEALKEKFNNDGMDEDWQGKNLYH
ncbi:DUF6154 family protein [Bacillus sp. FJAT-52991]|uniref:DUF6154 family protein n=1 Tax=Bacillus kandeliae TaxID=3129297 RepID=A0ABZ2N499_9BACI